LEGKTNLAAVQSAYDVTSKESGKALATQLMQDPDVKVAISDLFHQEGIGRRPRAKRLRAVIESNDLSVVTRGLTLAAQMAGEMAPERHEVIIDHQVILADLRAARQRLVDAGGIIDITPEEGN
jgi:hypothetical protein